MGICNPRSALAIPRPEWLYREQQENVLAAKSRTSGVAPHVQSSSSIRQNRHFYSLKHFARQIYHPIPRIDAYHPP